MDMGDEASNMDLDWENRVLCSDESCIGTIGTDGCCRECGRRYEGELPAGFHGHRADQDTGVDSTRENQAQDDGDLLEEPDAEEVEPSTTDDEWARRILCRDESCIGVIGEDGLCKECGKPY